MKQPTKLKENWLPDPKSYKSLERKGIPKEFSQHSINEFKNYWIVEEAEKRDWNRTFQNRVIVLWDWNRHTWQRRNEKQGASQPTNPFSSTLDKLQSPTPPEIPKRRLPQPQPPTIPSSQLTKEERTKIADKYLAGLRL